MISNISFGSTYKVSDLSNNSDAMNQFQNFIHKKPLKEGVVCVHDTTLQSTTPLRYKTVLTMIADDKYDKEIETYCANNGIVYSKKTTAELTSTHSILRRIYPPKAHIKTMLLDVEKFEKLIQNQQHNIDHCERMYDEHFKEKLDFIIKKGDKIPATTLSIMPNGAHFDDTMEYIEKYGAKNLNENQLFIDFLQQDDYDPDHCTYFALRDLGIKQIPVCVTNATGALGKALGILK